MRVALLLVAAMAVPAHADDTFESKAAGAHRVERIEDLVWALTAPCDHGDDTEQRQCRIVRDRADAEYTAHPLLIDADKDAFETGAFDESRKALPVTLSSCIRCSGVTVEGKTWFLFGSTGTPKAEGDRVRGVRIFDNSRMFAQAAEATTWARQVAGARVQLLVHVPAARRPWIEGGKLGLGLDIIAFRVIAPCDGSIVLANIASGPADKDAKSCAPVSVAKPSGPEVAELSMKVIRDALKPVTTAAERCYMKLGIAGNAKLKFTVDGDGTIEKYEQQGDLVGTPEGDCIDKAVKEVTFPRTKKGKQSFVFPLDLR